MMAARGKRFVVVVRHGERQDYVSRDLGVNWTSTAERPWDSPLTENGKQQALDVGSKLPEILKQHGASTNIGAIYSSPFLRCRQTSAGIAKNLASSLLVQVEEGLVESINENWYRSWALPGSDGTWGFQRKDNHLHDIIKNPEVLHAASKKPVQSLTDWKKYEDDEFVSPSAIDQKYVPKTKLGAPFCFCPPTLESFQMQRDRMQNTIEELSAGHADETVVMVSHGGPVTHLYESLTGNDWRVHGESRYCCFSIYQRLEDNDKWEPLLVNQTLYSTKEDEASTPESDEKKAFIWA